jgi:hypothetical protein
MKVLENRDCHSSKHEVAGKCKDCAMWRAASSRAPEGMTDAVVVQAVRNLQGTTIL